MPQNTENTTFTRDLFGRSIANTFAEARDSQDATAVAGARSFDRIVIGGGTFGAALAARMFARDTTRAHRILVLEAGPIALDEHVQNIGPLDTAELWGIPWDSDSPFAPDRKFPGLAYALGGRSLFWGGWSPPFVDSELSAPEWSPALVSQLTQPARPGSDSYFVQAEKQLGTDRAEDFVFGPLQDFLQRRLYEKLRDRGAQQPPLRGLRGVAMDDASVPEAARRAQLNAPLAVQAAPERSGTFPFNKFSAMPLLIDAACRSQAEARSAAPSDYRKQLARKRLMIVPNTRVIRLEREGDRIRRVVTNQGTLDLATDAQVFLALGTIENTRLAFGCVPDPAKLIGRNLMAHLRSNLVLRIRRDVIAESAVNDLQGAALFVKGLHTHGDGRIGHFHLQITASGTGPSVVDSEIELFKRIPDVDGLEALATATDEWVVVTIRGIGEMRGDRTSVDPMSRVVRGSATSPYDYGEPRAVVRLQASIADQELWDVMDRASEEVAHYLAGDPHAVQFRGPGGWQSTPPPATQRRDSLGSTHHEAGTLWMGNDPATSVTNEVGRFHAVANLFATGPALLPRIGSPNPMLSGIAMVRRLADAVVAAPAPLALAPGESALFDGTAASFAAWQTADPEPQFSLSAGVIAAESGSNLGLLFFTRKTFSDFDLDLEFRITSRTDNAGVHVRFRDPRQPVPNPADPQQPFVYDRKAYVAVTTGFEVQIDDLARGDPGAGIPDGLDSSRTGAIYAMPVGSGPGDQTYSRPEPLVPMQWNDLHIEVRGTQYRVSLNGRETCRLENTDDRRGVPAALDAASGYIGLQAHTGRVEFRSIKVRDPSGNRVADARSVPLAKPATIPSKPPQPPTAGPVQTEGTARSAKP